MNKIEFLEKYKLRKNADIHIFTPKEVQEIPFNTIPEQWYDIFSTEDIEKKINSMLNIWKKYLQKELSITIDYLEKHIIDIDLFRWSNRYFVLYSIKSENGGVCYYEGGNPLEKMNDSKLKTVWAKIPKSIRCFYEKIHNGFDDYRIRGMGLICLQWATYFGDSNLEWGILEDLKEPLQIDINSTFAFFESRAGGYVAIDVSKKEEERINKAVLWFADDQPDYNVNFWDVVDEWITIGMED